MSRARLHNFELDLDPEPPSQSPTMQTVAPGDTYLDVSWSYPGGDYRKEVDGYHVYYNVKDGKELMRSVGGADTLSVRLTALTNDTYYYVTVAAYNEAGESRRATGSGGSPKAPPMSRPILNNPAGIDNYITVQWHLEIAMPSGYSVDRLEAELTPKAGGSPVVVDVVGKAEGVVKIPADNDVPYSVRCRVIGTPHGYASAWSNAVDATATDPIAPYQPVINDVRVNADKSFTVKFAPEDTPNPGSPASPMKIEKWTVRWKDATNPEFSDTIHDGTAREWTSPANQEPDNYTVTVQATNEFGASPQSLEAHFTVEPADAKPLISGGSQRIGKDGYTYCTLYAGNRLDLASTADGLTVEYIAIGGGGAGAGKVGVLAATGGSGGGGEMKQGYMVMEYATMKDIAVTVGKGGSSSSGSAGGDTSLYFGNRAPITVKGGEPAKGKEDGAGTDQQQVDPNWYEANAFMWNAPKSYGICGSATWDKTDAPDGVLFGEGGGGTNGSTGSARPGNGQDGVVVLRWVTK